MSNRERVSVVYILGTNIFYLLAAAAASQSVVVVQNNPRHPVTSGHAAPDGPPSKSTVTAEGPVSLYTLPKASIIVLRGQIN